jgi:MFS family permease
MTQVTTTIHVPALLRAPLAWRTPIVILVCGCVISMLGFGPRSALGFFLLPMSSTNGWARDVFALALAIQAVLWGMAQPFAGALADRFGPARVLAGGAAVYAVGLLAMAQSTTPGALYLSAGLLIGFGLAGSSFTLVIGAFGALLPGQWRSLAFGAGTAAGSFGQFLFSPLAVAAIDALGWFTTLLLFAAAVLATIPLSLALTLPQRKQRGEPETPIPAQQTLRQAVAEAFGHRSYVLLVLGFFTCGFQLFFVTIHLPAYLMDRGLPSNLAGWTLATIGLFNIVGSLASGWLSSQVPNRWLLCVIYFGRAAAMAAFFSVPPTAVSTLAFGAAMGLLWLSTVPPTSALIAIMFGTRWFATLFGFAFFSHQVGGFLGAWLGGVLFVQTGSYDAVWLVAILLGVLSALINLPIVEKPAERRSRLSYTLIRLESRPRGPRLDGPSRVM